jgi:energy-coupling factor transporter ATP-binding protein EcfA2
MDGFIQAADLGKVQSFLAQDVTLGAFVEWLFSTDHIRVEYGIRYDGVELRHLSPGTRGIVLLILYLAIDEWDSRPLIADQPEENLDPQSVFDDLVDYFRRARRRRQVIIVTHNANLVINTDADQVIVASSQRVAEQTLPRFTYEAGPLEDHRIRDNVCRILEGGRRAFLKRERRYALRRGTSQGSNQT